MLAAHAAITQVLGAACSSRLKRSAIRQKQLLVMRENPPLTSRKHLGTYHLSCDSSGEPDGPASLTRL